MAYITWFHEYWWIGFMKFYLLTHPIRNVNNTPIRYRSVRWCMFMKLNSRIHVWWRPGWIMQPGLSRQDILVRNRERNSRDQTAAERPLERCMCVYECEGKGKGKGNCIAVMEHHVRATECHLSYGITQCYLLTDTSECTPPSPQPDRPALNLPTPEGQKAELT